MISDSFEDVPNEKKLWVLYSDVFQILDECTYVDDLTPRADDAVEALNQRNAKEIISTASINLRKWGTKDKSLAYKWKTEHFDIHPINLNDSNGTIRKVLRIQWDIKVDSMSVEIASLT